MDCKSNKGKSSLQTRTSGGCYVFPSRPFGKTRALFPICRGEHQLIAAEKLDANLQHTKHKKFMVQRNNTGAKSQVAHILAILYYMSVQIFNQYKVIFCRLTLINASFFKYYFTFVY